MKDMKIDRVKVGTYSAQTARNLCVRGWVSGKGA